MKNTIILFSLLFLTGCHYYDHKLKIVNNSDINISYYVTNKNSDSIPGHFEYYIRDHIKLHDTLDVTLLGKNQWERTVSEEDKKLSFYFFNRDSLSYQMKRYKNLDELRSAKLYYKMIALNKQELDNINWIVKVN